MRGRFARSGADRDALRAICARLEIEADGRTRAGGVSDESKRGRWRWGVKEEREREQAEGREAVGRRTGGQARQR